MFFFLFFSADVRGWSGVVNVFGLVLCIYDTLKMLSCANRFLFLTDVMDYFHETGQVPLLQILGGRVLRNEILYINQQHQTKAEQLCLTTFFAVTFWQIGCYFYSPPSMSGYSYKMIDCCTWKHTVLETNSSFLFLHGAVKSPFIFSIFTHLYLLSLTGEWKPFDKGAPGTV